MSEAVNTAAFFDLDKTIIAKSSVLAFGRSFYREGLLSRRSIVKSLYAQVMFMLVGADAQKMEKLRVAMSAMTRGWNRDQVASIVRDALTDVIEPIIYAEALELFDEHHAAGRKVVIVSSAPLEVVQPLSEFLGADEAIGTRAAIDSEGNYTGELEFYAYGDYKAQAVRELATRAHINLPQSYAYSDSITDLPMLELVGHPVAVNPDKELAREAREREWEIRDFEHPVRLRDRMPVPPAGPTIAVGGALAAVEGLFNWPLFLVSLFAILLLHIGTNITNEIYDVRKGVDTIVSPRASHAIVKGRIADREAYVLAIVAFAAAFALGVYLVSVRGWPIVALGLAGLIGGYTYTAPPFQYKFGSFGIPLVFLLLGPLAVTGSYYAITGTFDWSALAISIPVGLLVAAILHGNEWRDISEDARAGATTFSVRMGRQAAHWLYISLVVGAYIALTVAVLAGLLPTWSLLAILSLPLLVRQIRSAEFGASGQQRAIAMIDLQTAQLHAAFGYLMVVGLVIAAIAATR